jgi:hypothetical protein
MRRVSSSGGSGSNQPLEVFVSPNSGYSVVVLETRVSREARDVRGCDSVFNVRRTESGAIWRTAPPFAVFRIVACMS